MISRNLELDEHILNSALLDIESHLEKQRKSLSDFGGMSTPSHVRSPYEQLRINQEEIEFNVSDQTLIAETNVPLLIPAQLKIYNYIMEAINDSSVEQRAFFIGGPGGTGKTFMYNTLLAKVRSQGRIPLAMASSGIAALLLTGGRTVHSRLKVHIPLNEISVCNIPKQSALAKLIQKASLLVWDEAPMVHRHAAECIDRTLRDLCPCELPFGGKIIVFGGGFCQILPVIRHCSSAQVVSACINRSSIGIMLK